MNQRDAVDEILAHIDESDIKGDSTLQSIEKLAPILKNLVDNRENINVIVALGSGRGGFVSALSSLLDAQEVHAIDSSRDALEEASNIGLEVHQIDLECGSIPLSNGTTDLVVSLGLLEHLTWYDNVLSETKRVLRDGGFTVFAMPNMAGWTNRLSILTGNQPRNIEFSQQMPFGIMDAYAADYTVGHVHTPTVGAFREFVEYQDFEVIDTVGLHPYQEGHLVTFVDRLVDRRPSLCRRFAILARSRSGADR